GKFEQMPPSQNRQRLNTCSCSSRLSRIQSGTALNRTGKLTLMRAATKIGRCFVGSRYIGSSSLPTTDDLPMTSDKTQLSRLAGTAFARAGAGFAFPRYLFDWLVTGSTSMSLTTSGGNSRFISLERK